MPPRRRKVVCDDAEAVPAKKSRKKTETSVLNSTETDRSSRSKSVRSSVSLDGPISPAKKLKKKLKNLKEDCGLDANALSIDCVVEEVDEEIESKYFRGDDRMVTMPCKDKGTESRNKSTPRKVKSGKGEKLGHVSQALDQARRSGSRAAKIVSASKGKVEEEPKDDEMEEKEDVSKRKTQRKPVRSKSEATKADNDGQPTTAGEGNLNVEKSYAKPSTVTRPEKKSASAGRRGRGGRGRGGGRKGREEGGGRGGGRRGREEGGGGKEKGGQLEREADPLADDASSSSESESEWEEVEELPSVDNEPWKSQLPVNPIQITLGASELVNKKRKKGGFDVKEYFRLQLNRFRTETQRNAHKVHLLCLLSHGRYKNWVCCSVMLQSIALSLIPPEFTDRSRDVSMSLPQLMMFAKWFKKTILVDDNESAAEADQRREQLSDRLLSRFSERKALSKQEFILMFAISCRSIGLLTRLIYSLQPITFKPADLKKTKPTKNPTASAQKEKPESKKKSEKNSQKSKAKTDGTTDENSSQMEILRSSSSSVNTRDSSVDEAASQSEDSGQSHDPLTSSHRNRSGAKVEKREETSPRTEGNVLKTKNCRPRRSGSKVNYDEGEKTGDVDSEEDAWKGEMEDDSESTSSDKESESGDGNSGGRKRKRSSDDDFEESKVAFRQPTSSKKTLTNRQKRRKERQQRRQRQSQPLTTKMSTEIADEASDWWTEVYLEDEQKWICINGCQLQVNHPESVEQSATKPLSYVLAFDNGDGIKDVTKKYASEWLSSVKKIRLDESWWKNVLEPFQKGAECERDVKEEAYVQEQLLKKPMPTSISDFKNHSLYALKRHLLKYEAIYPPTAPIVGHMRGEPVYPRDCVHCLHAREKWRLEGRMVRIDEEPYKIVKARPKWNKPKEFNDRLKLLLYGRWQTEQFIPLPAVDGKIPKNEYGNVEVFKPWMIPSGTVYLPETMNGMGRVAKKLDVDVAPAMVGWDFHGGFNHPILQGWIVCEEHRDILVAAWEEDQAIQQQKEAEKKQQRILGNWKLLIKGLLIRERLKKRFDLQEPTVSKRNDQVVDLEGDDSEEERNAQDSEEEVKANATKEQALSWPENLKKKKKEEEAECGKGADGKQNLFPFEKDHQLSSAKL